MNNGKKRVVENRLGKSTIGVVSSGYHCYDPYRPDFPLNSFTGLLVPGELKCQIK